jgi:tetratricopeptide (TPR) repeat protein
MQNVFAILLGFSMIFSPVISMAERVGAQERTGIEDRADTQGQPTEKGQALSPQQAALPGKTLAEKRSARLDELFSQLKRETNAMKASRIASQIQTQWLNSGSASIDLMMGWASKAMEDKKYSVALDFLDQVIVMKPDYAEGWNRRATLNYVMNDYGRAMADIQKTLTLEPRHFGAMAGMASILKETGRKEAALGAFERVLNVYPMMRQAQKEVGELADELTGQRT